MYSVHYYSKKRHVESYHGSVAATAMTEEMFVTEVTPLFTTHDACVTDSRQYMQNTHGKKVQLAARGHGCAEPQMTVSDRLV
jgi:hypothetical protein